MDCCCDFELIPSKRLMRMRTQSTWRSLWRLSGLYVKQQVYLSTFGMWSWLDGLKSRWKPSQKSILSSILFSVWCPLLKRSKSWLRSHSWLVWAVKQLLSSAWTSLRSTDTLLGFFFRQALPIPSPWLTSTPMPRLIARCTNFLRSKWRLTSPSDKGNSNSKAPPKTDSRLESTARRWATLNGGFRELETLTDERTTSLLTPLG